RWKRPVGRMPLRIRIRSATADESNERSELEPRPEPRAAALRLAQLSADDQANEIPASSLGLGSRALRNTVIVLAAKVLARLIALFTVLYMVRWLGPPGYGSFSVLINLSAIASVLLDLGFNVLFVLESALLLGLVFYGVKTRQGVAYFVWAYAAQYAFSCVYFAVVLAAKRIATIAWSFEPALLREWFFKGLPFALTFVLTIIYFR